MKTVPAVFEHKENSAAFIIKEFNLANAAHDRILYDQACNMFSLFTFGASAGNEGNYFGVTREGEERKTAQDVVSSLLEHLPLVGVIPGTANSI